MQTVVTHGFDCMVIRGIILTPVTYIFFFFFYIKAMQNQASNRISLLFLTLIYNLSEREGERGTVVFQAAGGRFVASGITISLTQRVTST